ncbi:hypothetical protein [Bacillus mycoides]|uniref:hypothetical protein n=1 Tax=Bacillus mycoides TaxID=1405 RepID=UPI003A801EE1
MSKDLIGTLVALLVLPTLTAVAVYLGTDVSTVPAGKVGAILLALIAWLASTPVYLMLMQMVTEPMREKRKMKEYKDARSKLLPFVDGFKTVTYDVVKYSNLGNVVDLNRYNGVMDFDFVMTDEVINSLKGIHTCKLEYAGDDGLVQTLAQPVTVKYVKGIDTPVFEVSEVSHDKQVKGFSKFINPTLCIPNK